MQFRNMKRFFWLKVIKFKIYLFTSVSYTKYNYEICWEWCIKRNRFFRRPINKLVKQKTVAGTIRKSETIHINFYLGDKSESIKFVQKIS